MIGAVAIRKVVGVTTRLAGAALTAAAALSALPTAYLGVISVVGLPRPRPPKRSTRPTTRFAILVPAHDEAGGIADTLASFDSLEYPRDLYAVDVVADNCTDRTADVVRASGWCVHERTDPDDPGKGSALNWLLQRLEDRGDDFDAIVIIDADTTVDAHFLRAMDRRFTDGHRAVQGYYGVREPDGSSAAALRYAALACRHHLRPLGRTRLGASSGLYGNGMAFTREAMAGRSWSGHLVEDAEFQIELLLDGQPVAFAHDAVVWAEMPDTLAGSTSQNERWEAGRLDLARRFVPRLTCALPGARGRRVQMADAIADQLTPPLSVLVAVDVAIVIGASVVAGIGGRRTGGRALLLAIGNLVIVGGHVVAGLRSIGAPPRHFRALADAPGAIIWKVRLWMRMLVGGGEVEWTRTMRNTRSQ